MIVEDYSLALLIFLIELWKFLLSLAYLWVHGLTLEQFRVIVSKSFTDARWAIGGSAIALIGGFQFMSLRHLPAITFVVGQTIRVTFETWWRYIFDKHYQARHNMVRLASMMLVILQLSGWCILFVYPPTESYPFSSSHPSTNVSNSLRSHEIGSLALFIMCVLDGFARAYFERYFNFNVLPSSTASSLAASPYLSHRHDHKISATHGQRPSSVIQFHPHQQLLYSSPNEQSHLPNLYNDEPSDGLLCCRRHFALSLWGMIASAICVIVTDWSIIRRLMVSSSFDPTFELETQFADSSATIAPARLGVTKWACVIVMLHSIGSLIIATVLRRPSIRLHAFINMIGFVIVGFISIRYFQLKCELYTVIGMVCIMAKVVVSVVSSESQSYPYSHPSSPPLPSHSNANSDIDGEAESCDDADELSISAFGRDEFANSNQMTGEGVTNSKSVTQPTRLQPHDLQQESVEFFNPFRPDRLSHQEHLQGHNRYH